MCARCKQHDCVIRGETAGASCEGLLLREARRFLSGEFRETHPRRGRVLPPSWPLASPCLHVRRQTASKMSNFRRPSPFNAHLQVSLPIIAFFCDSNRVGSRRFVDIPLLSAACPRDSGALYFISVGRASANIITNYCVFFFRDSNRVVSRCFVGRELLLMVCQRVTGRQCSDGDKRRTA